MRLAERAAATDQVLERFRYKPFSWHGANCIRLARAQGVALGHSLPPVPGFRTPLGARRALKRRGFGSVSEMLDFYFERYPAPAFAIVGDLYAGPAAEEHGLEAVGIADGLGNVIGWHESTGFRQLETIKFAQGDMTKAWRL